jgi:threonine dehydratase
MVYLTMTLSVRPKSIAWPKSSDMLELADIEAAAERIRSVVVRTPLISSPTLDELVGGRVFLKAENLQRTGSFKFRGAYNFLSQLTPEQAARGVIAYSSGNHAQAVAAAGTMLGIATTIVMPEDAPRIKIENTRQLGAATVLYDRYCGDREAIAGALAKERKCEVVPPFDHLHTIAGQGTTGLEIVRQCEEVGVSPDQVLVNCSGGGLTAGCAIAICSTLPDTAIYAVEPEDFDDTCRSLASGRREKTDVSARSICDALQTPTPGEITFDINKKLLSGAVSVSDDEVRDAIRFAFRHLKLVVEPGGAVALAAVLSGRVDTHDKATVALLSGGNIDTELFALIQQGK